MLKPYRWLTVIAAALTLAAGSAAAQDNVIRIVVGYPAGAGSDVLARMVAEKMSASLEQPVIVENKPGASGIIASEAVKAAPPDGRTIILQPLATMVAFPYTYDNLRYDPFKDFEPIVHLADFQLALGVGAQVPAQSVKEYVALVKKDPKLGFFGSPGAGTLPHFFGLMFAKAAGIEMTHVTYKGIAPALQGLMTGEISTAVVPLADIAKLAGGGKAKVLAVSGEKRSPSYPQAPTFREAGYEIEGNAWYGLFAPAGTPKEVIARYTKAAMAAIKSPELNDRLAKMGLEPTGYGAEELAKIMKRDHERWGPVIKASGFKSSQ